MKRLIILFNALLFSQLPTAGGSMPEYQWIGVFDTALVESCDEENLFEKLEGEAADKGLALVRKFQACGIVFTSKVPLDIPQLQEVTGVKYIEADGKNETFSNFQ